MEPLKTRLVSLAKELLRKRGFALLRLNGRFGTDPFEDICRIAAAWSYPLDVVFDVGANDGDTALTALHRYGRAQVYSFEPHPTTFAALQRRIGPNDRFHPQNLGLASETGELSMIEYPFSKANSLVPNAQYAQRFGIEGKTVTVEVSTFDNFCAQHSIPQVDVLKIDTEGYELEVLKGATGMLGRKAIRFVYVEYNNLVPSPGAFGGALLPIDELLRPFGFRFIASYNDHIDLSADMFPVSNALFALHPDSDEAPV